ncbi:hypothetical protein DFH08DRAFT_70877 [Mycena albidolilacea]|uniref:Uncharacterized protein n=1 Tax=Mycena albidolilacea TaxID=1033008 RepID=A0AAD6Z1L6_9AGAR|nr:hypothetical protein DFH08DRAFT_70877 [Mycena albidolilacea]
MIARPSCFLFAPFTRWRTGANHTSAPYSIRGTHMARYSCRIHARRTPPTTFPSRRKLTIHSWPFATAAAPCSLNASRCCPQCSELASIPAPKSTSAQTDVSAGHAAERGATPGPSLGRSRYCVSPPTRSLLPLSSPRPPPAPSSPPGSSQSPGRGSRQYRCRSRRRCVPGEHCRIHSRLLIGGRPGPSRRRWGTPPKHNRRKPGA